MVSLCKHTAASTAHAHARVVVLIGMGFAIPDIYRGVQRARALATLPIAWTVYLSNGFQEAAGQIVFVRRNGGAGELFCAATHRLPTHSSWYARVVAAAQRSEPRLTHRAVRLQSGMPSHSSTISLPTLGSITDSTRSISSSLCAAWPAGLLRRMHVRQSASRVEVVTPAKIKLSRRCLSVPTAFTRSKH